MKRPIARSICAILGFGAIQHAIGVAAADVAVAVGDRTVNAGKLKPYDNALVASQFTADGRTLVPGIWTDQLRLRDVDGRKARVRTQTLGYFDGRVMSSVNMFDPASFAPIKNILVNPDGSKEVWTFTSASADGQITDPSGHVTSTHIPLKAPRYDFNCCMRSLIPAALPLAAGKTFALAAVPADGDPDVVMERVRGRERIRAGYRGMIDAWVVDSPVPGGGTVSFWIADTPPYLVHMTLKDVPANKTRAGVHYDQSFDMIGAAGH
jgi:hypothetical protein